MLSSVFGDVFVEACEFGFLVDDACNRAQYFHFTDQCHGGFRYRGVFIYRLEGFKFGQAVDEGLVVFEIAEIGFAGIL